MLTVALLGAAVAIWSASRNRFVALEHIPTADAALLSVDFHALRGAGLLSLFASAGGEEPEYLAFIRATGFDYQKDLDSALVSFSPQATYFLLNGRFDWKRLETYAQANGGGCYEKLCHLPGSTPQRRISFLPISSHLMAMAVSAEDLAATRLRDRNSGLEIAPPSDPVWVSVPAAALKRSAAISPGARLFASAVSGADRFTIAVGPSGKDFAARLEAICPSTKEAQAMSAELDRLLAALRSHPIAGGGTNGLTDFLATGSFQQSDRKVFGYWPVRKASLESLIAGT